MLQTIVMGATSIHALVLHSNAMGVTNSNVIGARNNYVMGATSSSLRNGCYNKQYDGPTQ